MDLEAIKIREEQSSAVAQSGKVDEGGRRDRNRRAKGVSRPAGEEESNVSVGSDTLGRGRTRPWFPTDQIRPRLDIICMELIQLTGSED